MSDPFQEEEALGRSYDGRLMRRFLGYVRPHAALVAPTVGFLVLRVGAELAGPIILQRAIDGPLARQEFASLAAWAAAFMATATAVGAFEFCYTWMTNFVGQKIILDLRMQVFSHLQRLSVSFFDRNPVGRLTVRITNDIENLSELFTSGLLESAADLLMIGGVVVMMFVVSPKLALLTMVIVPVVLWMAYLFRRVAREKNRAMRLKIARLNSYLNESVNGIRTIQIFGREASCLDRFRGRNAEHRDSAIESIFAYSIFYPGIEALSSVAVALLLWYGGNRILEGTLTFGTFVAFWYYSQKFFMPVRELAEKYNILQAAMASSERIFAILDSEPEVKDRPGALPAPPLRGEVEFQGVSFSYDGKTPVLSDLSFRVEPGRSLAVVGLTGAGKSTILNLLLRFYDPGSGSVKVDGRDLREYDLGTLRRQMGLVLQDVFLFAGSVEENIRLGEPGLGRDRILECARAVNADRFIGRLPRGVETDVMERGALLSTGERQLLSFARALAFDPRILILDEATSSVDSETERLIQEGLLRLMKGRTSIVIAHRLSTIQHADRILVLHKGRVQESGSHAELLRQDGLYRKLYRLQVLSGDAAASRETPSGRSPETIEAGAPPDAGPLAPEG
ncbi:MAG TPA: ABC transporter ATP-binding protein, partial [Planctomycetota bacterium]|nr:ABC transporter ATP-binding protein [Planctomycetota bacterium]